jgi:hypothetical protein
LQGVTSTDDTAKNFTADGNIDWTVPGDWGASNMGDIATTSETYYWIRVHTSAGLDVADPTVYSATLSRFGGDFARFETDGTPKFRVNSNGDIYLAGSMGIATSTPARRLEIKESDTAIPQLRLTNIAGQYAEFEVNVGGDLKVHTQGDDLILIDSNFQVCLGNACPTITMTGNGNLQVETDIYTTDIYAVNRQQMPDYHTPKDTHKPCPAGYISVPGNPKYNTADFCVMKYEAKKCTGDYTATTTDCSGTNEIKDHGTGDPASILDRATSYPENKPWISIQQDSDSAQEACENMGPGFHLITNAEWMTIADNIIHTSINDMDDDTALYQLATGHSDNVLARSVTSTVGADPVVSSCNLNLSLEDSLNAYTATCQLRGTGDGGYTDNDKGYYATQQDWADAYYPGSGQAQLRTHVLSNGEVIWDLAGNVWEWNSDTMTSAHAIESTSGVTGWEGYFAADSDANYLTNAQGFNIIPNISTSYTAVGDTGYDDHGIGRIYIDVDDASGACGADCDALHAFIRGGYWSSTSLAGVFTLCLDDAPSGVGTSVGFRCSR